MKRVSVAILVVALLSLGGLVACSGSDDVLQDGSTGQAQSQELQVDSQSEDGSDESVPDFESYIGMNAYAVGVEVGSMGWNMEFTDTAAKVEEYRNQTEAILKDIEEYSSEEESMTASHYFIADVLKVDSTSKTVSFGVLSKMAAEERGLEIK
ncbi:MAG: hypothetical protein Q4B69_04440 [Slackia sp.]|nr:hypothetical protein [Slackia sp.]